MQSTPSPTISTCQLPADNADGVMAVTPPAGCEVGTQHLDGEFAMFYDADPSVSVVNALHFHRPPLSRRYAIPLQFTQPYGFWMRVHAGCYLREVLGGLTSHRAARSAAGGAL